LAHAWSTEGLYNGHDPNLIRSHGAKVCGIDKVPGIVTGGVLADICRLHGLDVLPPSHLITADELDATTKGQARPGDALLLHTGWLNKSNTAGRDMDTLLGEEPGIGVDGANWVIDHDISLVGADTLGVEVFPPEETGRKAPIHITLMVGYGVHLVELMELEELSALEPDRFLFVAAPLRIQGGVNSPLNPLAVL
jgi:kynurenine formamidase